MGPKSARLYGLPERGQTDISTLLWGGVRKPDSWAPSHGRFAGLKST